MKDSLTRTTVLLAPIAAFFGSCCALPLLLLGLTGTASFASTFVPYQKYFSVGTVLLLALAFWLIYGRKIAVCEESKLCNPKSQRVTKILLWISTILAAIFLIGPHLIAP